MKLINQLNIFDNHLIYTNQSKVYTSNDKHEIYIRLMSGDYDVLEINHNHTPIAKLFYTSPGKWFLDLQRGLTEEYLYLSDALDIIFEGVGYHA